MKSKIKKKAYTIKKSKKAVVYTTRNSLDKLRFETFISSKRKTVAEIKAMLKKGTLHESDYAFTLKEVKEIAARAFIGGWTNCRLQKNHKSKWTAERGQVQMREIILNALTNDAASLD